MVRGAPNHFWGTGAADMAMSLQALLQQWPHHCPGARSSSAPPHTSTPLPHPWQSLLPSQLILLFLSSPAQAPLNLGFTLYYLYILFLCLGLISRGPPPSRPGFPAFQSPFLYSHCPGGFPLLDQSGSDNLRVRHVNESRPTRVFSPGASVDAAAKRSSFSRSCWTSESLWGPGLPTLRILSENKAAQGSFDVCVSRIVIALDAGTFPVMSTSSLPACLQVEVLMRLPSLMVGRGWPGKKFVNLQCLWG